MGAKKDLNELMAARTLSAKCEKIESRLSRFHRKRMPHQRRAEIVESDEWMVTREVDPRRIVLSQRTRRSSWWRAQGQFSRLENQFQRELQRTRAAGCIERVQIEGTVVQGGLCAPESIKILRVPRAAAQTITDSGKAWVIEKIESFGAKLQMQPVMDRKFAPDSKVHLPCSEPACVVSGRISFRVESGARRWNVEGVVVNDPSTWILRIVDVEWLTRY
jgi:hypothetical protein